jgi:negative regulator of sigma E activity
MASDTEPCLSFGEDLSALLDGELEAGREAELRAHLATCEPCRTHLASLASVNDGLRALVGRPVPANLEAQLFARIAAERENGVAQPVSLARRAPGGRRLGATFGAVALAAAAALALYLGVVRNRGPVEESPRIVQLPGPLRPEPAPAAPHGPQAAVPQLAENASTPEDDTDPEPELDNASDEDLGVAVELDTLEDLDDLDVIANLPLLERMEVGGKDAG